MKYVFVDKKIGCIPIMSLVGRRIKNKLTSHYELDCKDLIPLLNSRNNISIKGGRRSLAVVLPVCVGFLRVFYVHQYNTIYKVIQKFMR